MIINLTRDKVGRVIIVSFILLLVLWIYLFLSGTKNSDLNYIFGFLYAQLALVGATYGIIVSKKWGGLSSWMGRGIIFLSLGLLGEWFGQSAWTYLNVIAEVEVPYPSIADIGYFAIIPCYGLGMYFFAKVSGSKSSFNTLYGKIQVFVIPVALLLLSYFMFLKDLTIDLALPVKTFLDYGYPIGEAIVISLALLTYGLSKGTLGGTMKNKILFLIGAFILQYITDTTFLYRIAEETYFNGDIVDLMYATSFTVMTLALVNFSHYD